MRVVRDAATRTAEPRASKARTHDTPIPEEDSMRRILAVAALALVSATVAAQGYPAKPVRMIVPYPPGGGTDIFGRITAERMSDLLGQPVVVTNVAGGSGTVGSDQVRRAEPDGYTLLFNASLFALGKHVVKSTPYDPVDDFMPIGRTGLAPLLIVASPKLQAATLQDAIKEARANQSAFNMGLSGLGAAGHLATLEFMRLTELKIQAVPYKGTAPALADVMGGSTQLMIDAATALIPPATSGRVRGLAITSAARSKNAPDIPTTAEAGLPGLTLHSWYGVWGPKGLPQPVVDRLVAALADATRHPEFNARIDKAGILPGYLGPQEFGAFMRKDIDQAVSLLKAANFQPE